MLDILKVGDLLVETDSYDIELILLLDVETMQSDDVWRVLRHTGQKTDITRYFASTLYGNFQHVGRDT